jgi:gas vesicle protein
MSRRGGFFKGAVVGGLIAGTAALLFAPKAGKELRADIARKIGELNNDLDQKIKEAKKRASQMDGDAKVRQLELIEKAEVLRATLIQRSNEFSKSGKKITKVAAQETQKLIDQGKELAAQLDQYKTGATKDASKFMKKATTSASKVMMTAKNEIKKDTTKPKPKKK